jgi:HSP20 family protein
MRNNIGILEKLSFDNKEDFESMFKIFSKLHHPLLMTSDSRWLPAADLFETDDEVVIILDVANIEPRDMEISLKKDSIIIKGARHDTSTYKKRHYHKMEIDYGPFERTLDIPVTV